MGVRQQARRRRRRPVQLKLTWTQPQKKSRCVVCQAIFESPTLSIRRGKGQAHVFCAALDRIGLRAWAKTL